MITNIIINLNDYKHNIQWIYKLINTMIIINWNAMIVNNNDHKTTESKSISTWTLLGFESHLI